MIHGRPPGERSAESCVPMPAKLALRLARGSQNFE